MNVLDPGSDLPGIVVPYALRPGGGARHLVAGQVIHTLATARETGGTIGAVVVTAPHDPAPVPMHWHEHEHDTWFCLHGALQVWSDGDSRLLQPGDFAYVRPRGVHSYQCRREGTQFLGLVTPGSWIDFFADAGEPWAADTYPAPGEHPPNFPKLMAALGKYRINRVADPVYPAPAENAADQVLPGDHVSYFLQSRHGARHLLGGHLSYTLAAGPQTAGMFAMRMIEAQPGAAIPRHSHKTSHELIYVVSGSLEVTCGDGRVTLTPGMTASLPAGLVHGTTAAASRTAWIQMHAAPEADLVFETLGTRTERFMLPASPAPMPDAAALLALAARCDIIFEG